jgi:1-acyl-sn-glycerol-3-phosphate acyltransferase
LHRFLTHRAARQPALPSGRVAAATSRPAAAPWRAGLAATLRGARERAAFYGLLVLFGASSLIWSATAAVLYRLLPRRIGERLGQFVMMAGFRGFVGAMRLSGALECDFGGLDTLAQAPPLIIAPNHPSLLDAVLVLSRVPHVACAAKAEIWDNWFLGGGARLAGFIRNDSPARLVKEAVRQVRSGRHFLIFPEGTRSSARPVGDFKGGFALIARRAGAAVQPVFIETNSRFLGKGWPLFRRPELPLVYRIRLGDRATVEGDVRGTVDRLSLYYRRALDAGDP